MSEQDSYKDDQSSLDGDHGPLSPNSEFSLNEYNNKLDNLPKRKWSSKEVRFEYRITSSNSS